MSLLINTSALSALQNLSATQFSLTRTQDQMSSGLKVKTASDNVAYWSTSSTLKSDISALSAVSDALNIGASIISTAMAAIASTLTLLDNMKAALVTARQPGTSTTAVQTDITAQQQSLIAILSSASFNGVNLLDGSFGNMGHISSGQDIGGTIITGNTAGNVQGTNVSLIAVQGSVTAQQAQSLAMQSSASLAGNASSISQSQISVQGGSQGSGSSMSVNASASIGYNVSQISGQNSSISNIPQNASLTRDIDYNMHFVDSFSRCGSSPDSITKVGTVSLDTSATDLLGLGGVLNGSPGNSGSTNIITMDISASDFDLSPATIDLESAIASVTAVGALIAGVGKTIDSQVSYVSALSDTLTSGLGSLVDADMNVASTRLQALQTQQQLGIQALSIANGNSQLVLKLFGD